MNISNFRLKEIQKAVEKYTKIPTSIQTYFFNGRRLIDIVTIDESAQLYPKTSEENPLVLMIIGPTNLESFIFKPPFPRKFRRFLAFVVSYGYLGYVHPRDSTS